MKLQKVGARVLGTAAPERMCSTRFVVATLAVGLFGLTGRVAADDVPSTPLDPVTVIATRVPGTSFGTPASVDVVEAQHFNRDTLGVNLSDALTGLAGVHAVDRQNYAQDEQLSIRGFGARSTFGVRGVRLYVDGIPATQPDGQGQVSHFNLASADRVEVLRGPFSALYGNSSGGVVQIFTADGTAPAKLYGGSMGGSFGSWKTDTGASGTARLGAVPLSYNADYTHFSTDGFRDHSRARRDSFNGKTGLDFGSAGHLTLLLNSFSSPESEDPLGLTRAQFEADPQQSTSVASQFNTRKSVEQTQGGAIYDYALTTTQSLRLLGYYGDRQIRQFLSTPVSTQASPLNSGGVVSLGSNYGGAEGRWIWRTQVAGGAFDLVAGLNYDDLSQDRRGYLNFVSSNGVNTVGVQGNKRRDETNEVYDLDQFIQVTWQPSPRWSLVAGLRNSQVQVKSTDHFITATNPDDSGSSHYYATTPVAGVLYKLTSTLNLYGSYGSGFETPTLNELAYRPNGQTGLNFALQPARTRNGELGAKWRIRRDTEAAMAVFESDTQHELVIATSSSGRTTYQNANGTRRQGIEGSISQSLAPNWRLKLAYTYLDATVRSAYLTCTTTTCTTANTPVPAGSRIPGVAESELYGAMRWGKELGWFGELNSRFVSDVPVNDANSSSAPSYVLVGVTGGYGIELQHWTVRAFAQLDNLFNRDYIGTVIIDDSNGRFFEPGPGRSVFGGVRLQWK